MTTLLEHPTGVRSAGAKASLTTSRRARRKLLPGRATWYLDGAMPSTASQSFKFKKHDHIGALAAEQDTQFLQSCFVDTGAYEVGAGRRRQSCNYCWPYWNWKICNPTDVGIAARQPGG